MARRLALALAQAGAHVVAVARTVGGLEELDDKIKAAGGSATLVPLDIKDMRRHRAAGAGAQRALPRLDVLVGNAGILGPLSPLGHVEPKDWDNLVRGQCHRQLATDPHHGPAAASARMPGARCSSPRALRWMARAYFGAYAASKAALDALVRTYAAECAITNVRANLFSPGQTRTRMMRPRLPGVDPQTLPPPEEVAKAIVPLACPTAARTASIYDYPRRQVSGFPSARLSDWRPGTIPAARVVCPTDQYASDSQFFHT